MLSGQYLFHHQREESLERQVFGGGGKPRIPVFGLRHNLKTSGTTSIQASKAPAQLEASKPPAQLEASKPPAQLKASKAPAQLQASKAAAQLAVKPQKLRERLRKTKGGLRRHWDQLQCKERMPCSHDA